MDACVAERTDEDPPLPATQSPPQTYPEAAAATETTEKHKLMALTNTMAIKIFTSLQIYDFLLWSTKSSYDLCAILFLSSHTIPLCEEKAEILVEKWCLKTHHTKI